jgi:hypothetical protein
MTDTLIFRKLIPSDAESLIEFRKKIAVESTHTMAYIGMKDKTAEETALVLTSQGEGENLFLGVFASIRLVGSLHLPVIVMFQSQWHTPFHFKWRQLALQN